MLLVTLGHSNRVEVRVVLKDLLGCQLKDAGYDARDFKDAGYSASQLSGRANYYSEHGLTLGELEWVEVGAYFTA